MRVLRAALLQIPTVLAFAFLVGVGYWGHRTGWKVPSVIAMRGNTPRVKEDWCETHGVPDSRCIACHPELGGADPKDWCKEHGVPESKCTTCHPELLTGAKAKDWCKEHGVPESQCTVCHPEIAVKGEPPAKADIEVSSTLSDRTTHDPATCQNHVKRIQFASHDSLKKVGIQMDTVRLRTMSQFIQAPGEVSYDQDRVARISSRTGGVVVRVTKGVGQSVSRGDVMAIVDSVEVGRGKAELLQASAQVNLKVKSRERLRTANRDGYRSTADLQEAEAGEREARIRLLNAQQALMNLGLPATNLNVGTVSDRELAETLRHLGLTPSLLQSLDGLTGSANLIPIASPLDGVVTVRDAVAGESVETTRPIFTVVDTRRMWVLLDLRSEDIGQIKLGQTVNFEPDGMPNQSVSGLVSWISTAVNEKTRTVQVRAEVDNTDGQLRASTFGTGRITVRRDSRAIAVPDEAIQWEGCSYLVFVHRSGEIFQTRKVNLGIRSKGFAEVLAGVAAGEVVVTGGSHVLKSEVLKSSMGAGCVDD